MKSQDIFIVNILLGIQWNLASTGICPVGEPLALRECSRLRPHGQCPETYTCVGGVIGKGRCCLDALALLCRDCTAFKDVHYTMDDSGGSTFNMNVFFRWRRKECRESALLYRWDPHVKVLVKGQDNHTITERTLHCRVTEKPCSKYFSMKISLQRYEVLYQVKGPGIASYCRFREILTVSPQTTPLLPKEPPYSLSSATEPSTSSSSELVIAIVIGTTCFVAMATAVVFVCKSRFLRRRPNNNPNLVEFTLMQENRDVLAVAMPGVGSAVIHELKQKTGLLYVTIDQLQTDIFQNSAEWIHSIQQNYTHFLILLTESLVDNSEDESHPLNEITKSLFRKLHSSSQSRYKDVYCVYLTPPSALQFSYTSDRSEKNRYNLSGENIFKKRDFRRLVSDLNKIGSR